MVNWFAPGGEAVVACKLTVWFDPSGSVRLNWIVSPLFGLDASVTDMLGGEPLTVAPVRFDVMPASLNPNGDESLPIDTVPPAAGGMNKRPSPFVPASACARSAMTCLSPACAPLPLRI